MTADVIYLDEERDREFDSHGRVPPHDLAAERALLSAVWLQNELLTSLLWLMPKHFFSEAHRRCWEATLELRARGDHYDIVTVGGWLQDRNRIQQLPGGIEYLAGVLNEAPALTLSAALTYAARVFDLWRVREAIAQAHRIHAQGYVGVDDVQKFLDDVTRDFARVAWTNARSQLQSNTEMLRAIVKAIQQAQADRLAGTRGSPGLPTGIHAYDHWTGGLHAAQKITVGSVLGVGKTAWALQVSTHIARSGVGVLWILELSKNEMLQRQLAAEAQVNLGRILNQELSRDEWDRVIDAMPRLEALPILFDQRSHEVAPSVDEIRALVAQAIERCRALFGKPLGVLVVDYVQRLKPAPSDERKQQRIQIANASRGLESIAKEFKIAVVELAQLRIEKDSKGRVMRPTTGSIADSREIEKSSHVMVFLHEETPTRGSMPWGSERKGSKSIIQLMPKNRNGPKNQHTYLEFVGAYQTFVDPSMTPQSRMFVDTQGGTDGTTAATGPATAPPDPVDEALG